MNSSTNIDQGSLKARCGRSRQLTSLQVQSDRYSRPVRPVSRTGLTGVPDRSDRSEQPVRPVEPEPEQKAEEVVPTSAPDALEVLAAPSASENEELVDYEASPEHTSMEINVVRFSDDYWTLGHANLFFRSPRIQIIT